MEAMVAGEPAVLLGRDAERAAIDALLDGARAGDSGALVLRGGPGLGKTALLDDAARRADGLRILRATGAEAESDLPFAGLHQLLRPALDLAGSLPAPQAAALRCALGLESGAAPAPLLLGAAVLGLLAEAAPVAALVDDGQWLDAPSVAALAFAGRRLRAEGIALVAAVREEAPPTGLREHVLAPLADDAAAALLGDLPPAVRRALVTAAAGNPLALVELPAALTPDQLAGRAPLADPLPVPRQLEELFTGRLAGLRRSGPPAAAARGRRGRRRPGARAARRRRRGAQVRRGWTRSRSAGWSAWPATGWPGATRSPARPCCARRGPASCARRTRRWRHSPIPTAPPGIAPRPRWARTRPRPTRSPPRPSARGPAPLTPWPPPPLARAAELTPAPRLRASRRVAARGAALERRPRRPRARPARRRGRRRRRRTRADAARIRGAIELHRGSPARAHRLLAEAARALLPARPARGAAARRQRDGGGVARRPAAAAAAARAARGRRRREHVPAHVRRRRRRPASPATRPPPRPGSAQSSTTGPSSRTRSSSCGPAPRPSSSATRTPRSRCTSARPRSPAPPVRPPCSRSRSRSSPPRTCGAAGRPWRRPRPRRRAGSRARPARTTSRCRSTRCWPAWRRCAGAMPSAARWPRAARTLARERGLVLAEGAATIALAELELGLGAPDAAYERLDRLAHGPGAHQAHRHSVVPTLVEAAARAGRPEDARAAAEGFAEWARATGIELGAAARRPFASASSPPTATPATPSSPRRCGCTTATAARSTSPGPSC